LSLGYLELFFGKSFTGKTARMLHEVRASPRLLILDPKCAQLAKLKGFEHLWPEYSEKPKGWADTVVFDYLRPFSVQEGGTRLPFRAVVHVRDNFREQLERVCYLLRKLRNVTLCVDELGLFIPSGVAGSLPPAITSAMISGRHEGLTFCGTAQIPSLVHFIARSNASRIRWYRTTEINSLKAAQGYMAKALVDSLPTLPDYVCIETADGAQAFRDESLVGKIKTLGASPHVLKPRKK
jgi:hypothetical protein